MWRAERLAGASLGRAACSSPTWGDRENASFCRELGNTLWDVLL